MGLLDFFRNTGRQIMQRITGYKELGTYKAVFSSFGTNIYKSEVVRYCIRPIAEHTSKANARCRDKSLERMLNYSPNVFMNGKDFLAKVRTKLELLNTAFIYIERDRKTGAVLSLYPIPYKTFEALEYDNGLFIRFTFYSQNVNQVILPWEDLAVVRKDYNESDIAGDDNGAILNTLELISTSNQGVANAIKSTANLRGILKSTKAMLSRDDIEKQKKAFTEDYLNLENEGGIASLDATQEFTPISMSPVISNWEQDKQFREDVMRYFGVSDAIIMSDYTEEQLEAFYEARIEPFLVALSLELTRKIFTERERAFGSEIVYESGRMMLSSNKTKLAMVSLVDRGALTPNEWRMLFNLAPIEGGDVPIRRLDTVTVDDVDEGDSNDD